MTTADTLAAYLLDEVQLTSQFRAILGVRYDHFEADYISQAFANPLTHAGAAITSLTHVDSLPSWRAALVWQPTEAGMIYVSYGTSFNPSAEQLSLSASTVNLAPEKNETFELGEKWQFFADRLLVTTALFHTEQDNIRETDPTNSALQILAGDGISKGVELQLAGKITDQWQIQGGYAYDFTNVVSSPQSDLGHRLANAPLHTGSVWTTYTLPYRIEAGLGANYVGNRWASTTARAVGGVNFWSLAPDYWTMSTMLRAPIADGVSLQLNVNNLTNENYIDLIHPSHVVPGAGRSAMVTLSAKL
jgi:catecholate siderophore receptor